MGNAIGTAKSDVVFNFALQHLKAAILLRDHVSRVESENAGRVFGSFFEEIRSYTSASIMSSVASLETLINELFIAQNKPLRLALTNFEVEFWGDGKSKNYDLKRGIEGKRILDKYQKALELLDKPKYSGQETSFEAVQSLIELRNSLVHYKPNWDSKRQRQLSLEARLAGKYQLSPFVTSDSDFVTMLSMSSGCACWAVTTVIAFMKDFDSRTNLDPIKMDAFWNLEI